MEVQVTDAMKNYYEKYAFSSINDRIRDKLREAADEMAVKLISNAKLDLVFHEKIDGEDVLVIKMNLK